MERKRGLANLFRGVEAVGGRLVLDDERLTFTSHAFNAQTGPELIELADIARVEKVWTKVFGVVPMAPNGLAVTTTAGREFRFVLFGRTSWMTAIEEARQPVHRHDPAT